MAVPPFAVSHVVVDVDGTLVDFVGGLRAGLRAAASRCSELAGTAVTPRELQLARNRVLADRAWRARPPVEARRESFRRLLAAAGAAADEATVAAVSDLFFRTRDEASIVFPDAHDGLRALAGGGYTLIAASNGNMDLEAVGLDGYFTSTQFAPQVGVSKPDPRFFSLAVEHAGGEPALAAAVGDRLDNDYEPARAAGLHSVLIDRAGEVDDPAVLRIGALTQLPALLERA